MTEKTMTIDNIERQQKYVDQQRAKGSGFGIVFADAFLRGMRDLGYKSPPWAMAEILDNSFQAGASNVAVRVGFERGNKGQTKQDLIAICDNGNGMIPEMISYAVRWGGTDREGDRTGFGRYGYGLPSAAVSMAKRYTVYAKAKGGDWHAVTVDIDALAAAANDATKTQELLAPRPAEIPSWILNGKKEDDKLDIAALESGVVVVFEDLDRLRTLSGYVTVKAFRTKLLQHFGVIYRHLLPERRITVDGKLTESVDPLFLMEHGRHFAETSVRAQRVETRSIDVETSRGTKGKVTIRASVLPPHFQLKNPADYGRKGAATNDRYEVMRDFNGILVCRERRQIDCVQPRWTKFQNYDRNLKIEIDFEADLDEYFGITTSKQQIVIADEMWEQLQHSGKNGGGLVDLVADIRTKLDEMRADVTAAAANAESVEVPRVSIEAMERTEKFREKVPEPTKAHREEAQKNLELEAESRAEKTGKPKQELLEAVKEETTKRRWEITFERIPEGPFYRPLRLGEQKRVIINTEHPFYTKLYNPAPGVRPGLEILLMVLAERELLATDDGANFYKSERNKWSERLRFALDVLSPDDVVRDGAAAFAESLAKG